MINLYGKKVIIGVSGSIAAYKSLELARLFIKSGARVQMVMSESAKRFVTPLSLEVISQNEVLHEACESWSGGLNHINIKQLGHVFIIAPATANTINKLANGICDNLLLQSALAYDKQIILAPAANTKMLEYEATKENIAKLKKHGFIMVEPQESLLACNEEGKGAMAEPVEIFYKASAELLRDSYWSGKKVLISGGGTSEKIDDVRSITNASSGKMASNMALALYLLGAEVEIVASAFPLKLPKGIRQIVYKSSLELQKELESRSDRDYLFMAAAVSDFTVKNRVDGKIKKEGMDSLSLELEKNIDILRTIGFKGKKIGFKAETDDKKGLDSARKMLVEKALDGVCLNYISGELGFGSDEQHIFYIDKNGVSDIGRADKLTLGFKIAEHIKHDR